MTSAEMFEWLDLYMIEALIYSKVLGFDESGNFTKMPTARAAHLTFTVDPALKTIDSVEASTLSEAIIQAARVRQELLDQPRSS